MGNGLHVPGVAGFYTPMVVGHLSVCCFLVETKVDATGKISKPMLEASSSQYYPVGPAAVVSVLYTCTVSVLNIQTCSVRTTDLDPL